MTYSIEVKVKENNKYVWRKLRPIDSEPYTFKTLQKAKSMLNMCYPYETKETVRITTN